MRNQPSLQPALAFQRAFIALVGALIYFAFTASALAQDRQSLHPGHVPAAVGRLHLQPVDNLPDSTNLTLAVGLPLRNREELTNLLHQLYDPASPLHNQALTSEQFTEEFGPTQADYDKVIAYLTAHGLTVVGTHPNRVVLDVAGSVADIQKAFHVNLRVYQHPTENRSFYAPDVEPSVDAGIPMADVSGLDNYVIPHPMGLVRPDEKTISFSTGSGPNTDFFGLDFRGAYAPGVTLDGTGQTIGLFEFGPYYTTDVTLYQQASGFTNTVITNVLLDGFTGIPPGTNSDDGEESLDIDMVMSMAPGANIIVYEGNSAIDILNRIATDNKAKQISCSFGFLPPPSTMDTVLMQFAAQKQVMFVSSGDSGAYNSSQSIFAPADDPNIVSVGGTALTTTTARGPWVSETTWIGSGGGISQTYSIPSYQSGMNMSTNHGSMTLRNFPDVSMLANPSIFWFLKNGQSGTVGGTSAAAPLWAGFMALVNQQTVANGNQPVGFLNPIAYAIGRSNANYANLFHDMTVGSNTNSGSPANFFAIAGFDLATGWGTPNGSNLINFLATPLDALNITPGIGFNAIQPYLGAPVTASLDLTLTNAGASLLNWSLSNSASWLDLSTTSGTLTPGGGSATVTGSLDTNVVATLAPGFYSSNVRITNTTSGTVETRLFTLNVSTANNPIALTGFNAGVIVPNNATTANKMAVGFDIPNNIAFYQNGLNTNPQVSGSGGTQGLPLNGTFTSFLDNSTIFQFGPYGGNNALMLGDTRANTGTLSLVTPQAYDSLVILASSANGGGSGSLVINFADGSSSPTFNFNAQDWFGSTANVALRGFGRLDLNSGLFTENNGSGNPNLYQTTINLAALGLNQPVSSIAFTKPNIGGSQDTGIFAISGSLMPPQTVISQQPQSVTNNNPGTASTFTVFAMGTPPLAYQWFSGTPASGTLLSGQTNSTLAFTPAVTNEAGPYFVVVSNSLNAVTSSVATLTVLTAPQIVVQPAPPSLDLFVGRSTNYSVGAIGALPLFYQWFNGTNPIPGAVTTTLSLNNLQLANSGNYSAVVSNAFGAATSSVVSLTVVATPTTRYPVAVLADHPIAYWRLDETSGTVAHDYLNGNNGVYTNVLLNQPGYSAFDPDRAAKFGSLSGNNSFVNNIPIDFSSTGNATFSIEAWVNGGSQTTDAGIVAKGTGGGGEQFNLDTGSTSHAFRFFIRDSGGGTHLANGTITPGSKWHHLVGVCDEPHGTVSLYIDGVLNASATGIGSNSGILSSTNPVNIGARQSGTGPTRDDQFVGTIDEVAIYNVALTATQVATHFSAATNTQPPSFPANPFTEPAAAAGQFYSNSIAATATDPNGSPLTFSKISGPAWLSVAANGSISGTPAVTDAGPNSWTVGASDLGGLSANATMLIFVSAPPVFTGNPFAAPVANAGQPYSASIAASASDPDGDTLIFSEISGPAWLGVGPDGTLSGTPAISDIGTNTFIVSATDPTGNTSSNATMTILVNGVPSFTSNPFTEPAATAGQPYSGSIASAASDPDGDALTFAGVSGPAWLGIGPDGTLSGTPAVSDVGTNSFVVSATDQFGAAGSAVMNIVVAPAPSFTVFVSLQGTNIFLSWSGGNPPYQVQTTADLVNISWQNLGSPITDTNLTVPITNTAAFYRVQGQSQ